MSVIVNTQPVNVDIVTDLNVDIITEPVNVAVNAARGATGVVPERILYVVDVTRSGSFLGTISITETLINNTGKTFTWQGTGIEAVLSCSDPTFFEKVISITWCLDGSNYDTAPYYNKNGNNQLVFSVKPEASNYRCAIEFYNF